MEVNLTKKSKYDLVHMGTAKIESKTPSIHTVTEIGDMNRNLMWEQSDYRWIYSEVQ